MGGWVGGWVTYLEKPFTQLAEWPEVPVENLGG